MTYVPYPRPCGDFRTSYAADMTMFRTRGAMIIACAGVALLLALPLFASDYVLSQLIVIGIYGIAALGLNVLVGFTGQISLGRSAFVGFGAFASAWLGTAHGVPPLISIPIAGVMTTALGMIFGIPAARLKGLYLAIATLAAQFILEDFFARAQWFTGGSSGAPAEPASLFGLPLHTDKTYFYVVLVTAFIVLVPKFMQAGASTLADFFPAMQQGVAYIKEMSIGAAIILFLIFEPQGLIHRWRLIRASFKLYPFSY